METIFILIYLKVSTMILTAVAVSVNHTIPEQNTFRVYRVKLHQTEDLQEDGLAKCRDYSPHFTYHDCTLASIDQVHTDSVE